MKQLILFLVALTCTAFTYAQQSRYTVDQHTWAGGICCSGGTDYTISLQFPAKDFVCFDSVRVETHGISVAIADSEFHRAVYGDSIVHFTLKFGSSYSERYNVGEYTTGHYGLEEGRVHWTGNPENRITLLRGKREEVLENVLVTDSMTAYP